MSADAASAPDVPVRRWPRRMAYGMAGLAVALPWGTAGAAWYFAAQVVTPSREYPVLVCGVDGEAVTVTRTDDTARPIPLGLVWVDGHAQLGDVVRADRATVVRRVVAVTRGALRAGCRAYTSSFIFDGDPRVAHGLDFADVVVPGDLGGLPAWLVGPDGPGTWVIAVHGRGAHRGEALRVLPTLAAAGMTTLVVSYRNDEGAPASPDGRFHLGDTEWRDVAAGIRYACSRGATGVILYGWSMGGAMALHTLRRAPEGGLVRGVVLDCPVIDWITTLRLQAVQRSVPPPLTWAALRLVEQLIGVRLADLDHRPYAPALPVPVLAMVDADDALVPPGPTRQFAAANTQFVRLVETRGGGHVRSWNVDRERYEAELAAFVRRVAGG